MFTGCGGLEVGIVVIVVPLVVIALAFGRSRGDGWDDGGL